MPSCSCGIDLLEAGAGRSDAASELAGRLRAAPATTHGISEVPRGPPPCVSSDEIGALVAILTVLTRTSVSGFLQIFSSVCRNAP